MNIQQIAQAVDQFALAFVFGATAWFFFVQSPVLLKKIGREKFVPIQMMLTVVLFRTLTVLLFVMLGATTVYSPLGSVTTIAAGVALMAGLINQFVVVPRALKAGGQSRREIKGKDSDVSTAGFASEGAGNRTQGLHRLVVLFVVIMLGGVIVHSFRFLAP